MLDSRRGPAGRDRRRRPYSRLPRAAPSFRDVSAVQLARHAARELLYRSGVDGREIDEVVFSQVVASALTPNVAREVSLLPQLPPACRPTP